MSSHYIYRKCQCRVWPFAPLDGFGTCDTCGMVPDVMPDYDDYVALQQSRARIVRLVRATNDKALIEAMYENW